MRTVTYVLLAVLASGQPNFTFYIDSFCQLEYPGGSEIICANLPSNVSNNVRVDVRNKFKLTRLSSLSFEDSRFDAIPEGAAMLLESVQRFSVKKTHVKLLRKRDFFTGNGNSTILELILQFNDIRDVPSKVFELVPNLQRLTLNHNLISNLEKDCFYGLGQLRWLKLDYNELTTINEDIFVPLQSVELIRLTGNKLEYLPENLFSQNLKLRYLYLGYNELKIIDERVVKNHRALQLVLTNFNSSTNITSTAVFKHPSLKAIQVSGNTLPYISSKTFAKTPNLTMLWAVEVNLYFVEWGAFENQGPLDILDLSANNLHSFDVFLPRINGTKDVITLLKLADMTLCEVPPEYEPGWSTIRIEHGPLNCSGKSENEKWSSDMGNHRNSCQIEPGNRRNSWQIDAPHFYMLATAIVILLLYSLILTLFCCYYRNKATQERLYYVIDESDPLAAHRNEERKC